MICCNLKNLSIQNSPDTIEQAISPDLHVVGIPEHTFNNMKNLIIGFFKLTYYENIKRLHVT